MTFSLGNALLLQIVAHETLQNDVATLDSVYKNLIPIDPYYTHYEVLDFSLGQLQWMGLIQQVESGFKATKLGLNFHGQAAHLKLFSKEAISHIWARMEASYSRRSRRHRSLLDPRSCDKAYARATRDQFVRQDALILAAIHYELIHHKSASLKGIQATIDGMDRSVLETTLMEQGLTKLRSTGLIFQAALGFITSGKGRILLKRAHQVATTNESLSMKLLRVLQTRFPAPVLL